MCVVVCVLMCVLMRVCKEKDFRKGHGLCVRVHVCKEEDISCVRDSGKEDNPNNPGVSRLKAVC